MPLVAQAFTDTLPGHAGVRGIRLQLPTGESAFVAEQGGQVMSWQARSTGTVAPQERLYTSPQLIADGQTALRGGVPICFPQFNARVIEGVALPKHGFARNLRWALVCSEAGGDHAVAELRLGDGDATRALWPHRFALTLRVELSPGRLHLGITITNRDQRELPCALALHTYLRVSDIATATLTGLDRATYWDAVQHGHQPEVRSVQPRGGLRFVGETDRVYQRAAGPLVLEHAQTRLRIEQSDSFGQTVVWNPGRELCARLADMPPDGYQHMLCVEAAAIDEPVRLAAGAEWTGAQTLIVENP